jgi:hypothetical protein
MKQQKRKFLILALASVLGAATLGVGAMSAMADTATDESKAATYSVTDVFTKGTADVDVNSDFTTFKMKSGSEVTFTTSRNLAWKWFAKNEQNEVKANYLNFAISFADANFKEFAMTFEIASMTANDNKNKVSHVLKFTNVDGTVYASVNPAKDADPTTGTVVDVLPDGTTEKDVKVTLAQPWLYDADETNDDAHYGEYDVMIDGIADPIGKFDNVGATSGKY